MSQTEDWLHEQKCTNLQKSNLQLRVAADEEIDSDAAPDCRVESKDKVVAPGRDGMRFHRELSWPREVECEVLDS